MRRSTARFAWISALLFVLLAAWDASGGDMVLASLVAGPQGFPLRNHWMLTAVLHTAAKWLAWLLVLGLCLSVTWPLGALQRMTTTRRVQLASTTFLASGLVALVKMSSHISCPWDMQAFGGVAHHIPHWLGWSRFDGGSGGCFPAGHATTGFAFIGGFFALRHDFPRAARLWLAGAVSVGLLLGISQQLRGAHFMSHTLWTGWLCWMMAWATDPLFARMAATSASPREPPGRGAAHRESAAPPDRLRA